jgi:hypothetical protein
MGCPQSIQSALVWAPALGQGRHSRGGGGLDRRGRATYAATASTVRFRRTVGAAKARRHPRGCRSCRGIGAR